MTSKKPDKKKLLKSTDANFSGTTRKKLKKKTYNKALADFQVELVKLQKWVQDKGLRVVVIFEGRDKTAHQRSNPTLEDQPDGSQIAGKVGRVFQG